MPIIRVEIIRIIDESEAQKNPQQQQQQQQQQNKDRREHKENAGYSKRLRAK